MLKGPRVAPQGGAYLRTAKPYQDSHLPGAPRELRPVFGKAARAARAEWVGYLEWSRQADGGLMAHGEQPKPRFICSRIGARAA